jgi:leader peptidase (prepilin peptidase)/N-methyltransferase
VVEYIFSLLQSLHDLLEGREIAVIVAMGVFGLLIGSFLSVVVVRLPVMLYRQAPEDWAMPPADFGLADAEKVTLIAPRSRCAHCRHQLRWYENIPIVSYVFLRARCAACQKSISVLYPVTELLACIAAILAVIRFGGDISLLGALVLSFALIAVSLIDIRHFIIPDHIVLPMIWLGLLCNAFEMLVPLQEALFGAVAGYVTLWSIYWLHRILTGKEGMGYGDFKLAAMVGAWLGIDLVPVFLVLAFAGGALFGAGLIIAGRAKIASAISFGPILALAGWVSLYWGDTLISAYWRLTSLW